MAQCAEGVSESGGLTVRSRRFAIEEGSGGIRLWRCRLLFQLDLQELRRELGDVTFILHRGKLLSTLRDLAAAAEWIKNKQLNDHCLGNSLSASDK
jgi:hypothetical protein